MLPSDTMLDGLRHFVFAPEGKCLFFGERAVVVASMVVRVLRQGSSVMTMVGCMAQANANVWCE